MRPFSMYIATQLTTARKPHLHREAFLAGRAEPPEARCEALQRGHLVAVHACQ